MIDNFNLERFKKAQEQHQEIALAEIKNGCKITHWMWFIFPQIKGLGASQMSAYYAIQSKDEAVAYLSDSILRENLLTISNELLLLEENNPKNIFGGIDSRKLQSSMTLFASISPNNSVFHQVIDKYFYGKHDFKTLRILENL